MKLDPRKLELLKTLTTIDTSLQKEVLRFVKAALDAYRKNVDSKLQNALSKVDAKLRTIRNGRDGRDGKDGKPGRDGRDGIDGINGENGQDGSPDTPEQVRDKLESLEGEERLDASAIKGLDAKIKEGTTGAGGNAGAFQIVHSPRHEQFTMNGSDTTVSLAEAPAAGGRAAWVHYNGQFLALSNTYTIDGNKITFTFTPEADTTVEVLYIP